MTAFGSRRRDVTSTVHLKLWMRDQKGVTFFLCQREMLVTWCPSQKIVDSVVSQRLAIVFWTTLSHGLLRIACVPMHSSRTKELSENCCHGALTEGTQATKTKPTGGKNCRAMAQDIEANGM